MEVLHRIGDSHLAAYDTGPLWVGAEGTPFDVERFTSYEGLSALVRRQVGAGEHPLVIIAVKPFPRTLGWGAKLRNELGDATRLVADVDDADLPLQRAWRRREPPRVRVRRFLSENRDPSFHTPLNIRRTLWLSLPRADLLFLSTWALRVDIPRFRGPALRLPHPRPRQDYLPPSAGERLRLGFLGTPRKHKGFDRLLAILASRADVELHLLEGTPLPPGVAETHGERLVIHPLVGADTLPQAFADIDVVVLPQDAAMSGGRLQLPAKLLDAQRFGRPVVATATPPIVELGGPGLIPIDDWRLSTALTALDGLVDPAVRTQLGRAANKYFNENLSAEVQARALAPELGRALGLEPPAVSV